MRHLVCKDLAYKYQPLSIARYSLIQMSKLEQNKLVQGLTVQHKIWTQVLSQESKALATANMQPTHILINLKSIKFLNLHITFRICSLCMMRKINSMWNWCSKMLSSIVKRIETIYFDYLWKYQYYKELHHSFHTNGRNNFHNLCMGRFGPVNCHNLRWTLLESVYSMTPLTD